MHHVKKSQLKHCRPSRKDILGPSRRVELQFSTPHSQHVLDGGEILLIDILVVSEFSPEIVSASALYPAVTADDEYLA